MTSDRGNLTRYYSACSTPVSAQFRPLLHGPGRRLRALRLRRHRRPQRSRRDRREYGGRLRLGYQLSPRIGTVRPGHSTTAGATTRRQTVRAAIGTRTGYALRSAPTIDITSILFGEVVLRLHQRDYDDDDLDDGQRLRRQRQADLERDAADLVILDAAARSWRPRSTFEGDDGRAPTSRSGRARGEARAPAQRAAQRQRSTTPATTSRASAGPTTRYDAGAGVSYLLNRNLSLDATYRFTKRDSDENDAEFDRNRAGRDHGTL